MLTLPTQLPTQQELDKLREAVSEYRESEAKKTSFRDTFLADGQFRVVATVNAVAGLLDLIDAQQKKIAERDAALEEAAAACETLQTGMCLPGERQHPLSGAINETVKNCAAYIRALKATP